MTTIDYGFTKTLDMPFAQALARAKEMLATEGFGVLCEIDLQAKLKEKLGVEFREYVILGACNPPLAYRALQEEIGLGLLLPCNVAVWEQEGRAVVAAIDAAKMMSVVGNPRLASAAQEVNDRLQRVIEKL
ncbi:MAG: DUF302 domain-containing protein [Blastocatellia bacterium]|nr:DUF302 domain-containing protein [Blastocatellia bacterium]